jgi:fatty acid desaturase
MVPEAWNVEHNRLHHYHLGENKDPDLVQRNLEFLRDMKVPTALKYPVVAALASVWKWFYYAPNTYKELELSRLRKEGKEIPSEMKPTDAVTVLNLLLPKDASQKASQQVVKPADFFLKALGPFFFSRFVLLPAPLLLIPGVGPTLFGHAMANLLLADIVTNIHGFVTIVTNHAGEDVYTFDDEVKPKTGSFYVRQIVGSANYATGTDLVDFSHGWLNYQIEHHGTYRRKWRRAVDLSLVSNSVFPCTRSISRPVHVAVSKGRSTA